MNHLNIVTEFTDSTVCVLSSYTKHSGPGHLSGSPGPLNSYRNPPSVVYTVDPLHAEISDLSNSSTALLTGFPKILGSLYLSFIVMRPGVGGEVRCFRKFMSPADINERHKRPAVRGLRVTGPALVSDRLL